MSVLMSVNLMISLLLIFLNVEYLSGIFYNYMLIAQKNISYLTFTQHLTLYWAIFHKLS